MRADWHPSTLGAVVDFISGGTPSKDRAEYWGGAIPWVSAKDMKRFRLEETEDHVTEEGAANGTRLAAAGNVLLLVRGMTLLNDVPICVTRRPMTFNQDIKGLRSKAPLREAFLPYLLLGYKQRLLSMVDLAGHGTGRLNTDELKRLDILLPPPTHQRAIAEVLGALDDKIERNRRMSDTLENAARSLFDAQFGESADWGAGKFSDVVQHHRDQENPLGSPDALFAHFSLPAFDKGQSATLECGQSIKSAKWQVKPGAILLSKLNPEIERVWLVDVKAKDRAVCSTEFLVLYPRHPFDLAYVYCLARSPMFRRQIESLVTGTSKSHQRAHADAILNLPIVLPTKDAVVAFQKAASPLLQRTLACRRESRTLTELRDSLLPKLISGELRIRNAERLLEETV